MTQQQTANPIPCPTDIQSPDAGLLSLGNRLRKAWLAYTALGTLADGKAQDEAYATCKDIVEAIEAEPAYTLQGFAVKALAIQWCHMGEDCPIDLTQGEPQPCTDMRLANDILRGLLATRIKALEQAPGGGSSVSISKDQMDFRVYHYTDARWISLADDNYGIGYMQATENAGTQNDPIFEWENRGWLYRSGEKLASIDMMCRPTNNTEVADWEVIIAALTLNDPNRLYGSGVNADSQRTATVLSRFLFMASSEGGTGPYVTQPNRQYARRIDVDWVAPSDWSQIRIFGRPVRTGTASTRYAYPASFDMTTFPTPRN